MRVGVCLDEQIVDHVPREAHDATVDMSAAPRHLSLVEQLIDSFAS